MKKKVRAEDDPRYKKHNVTFKECPHPLTGMYMHEVYKNGKHVLHTGAWATPELSLFAAMLDLEKYIKEWERNKP